MVRRVRHVRVAGVLFLMAGFGALLAAQEGMQREGRGGPPARVTPTHRVAGLRDGVSIFPKVDYAQLKPLRPGEVDFKHDHSYEETIALLKMWVARYPDLVDLYPVGQSFEGRDIWQITITNKKAGKDTDKPAFFLEGGRHAGEISGIETTLYFIDHVLSSYGTDPAITKLVDTKALYVRPNNDPDGNTLDHLTAVAVTPAKAGAGVFEVQATVTNEGLMPTALEVAKRVKIVRPDACTIRLGSSQELVRTADGRIQPATIEIGWLKPCETKIARRQVMRPRVRGSLASVLGTSVARLKPMGLIKG